METACRVGQGAEGKRAQDTARISLLGTGLLSRLATTFALAGGLLATPRAEADYQGALYWDAESTTGLQAGDGRWTVVADALARHWCDRVEGNDFFTYSRLSWGNNITAIPTENNLNYNGSDAIFHTSGASNVEVSDNEGTVKVHDITFEGSGYTITGDPLTLTGGTITANQDATIEAVLAGDGIPLTKLGSATLTLSAANSYSGNTIIHQGTLKLAGAGAFDSSPVIIVGDAGSSSAILDVTAKSAFAVLSGQTLRGIGTVNLGAGKTLTVNADGLWAPGNSIGTNSVTGNLALSGTSDFELGTPGSSHAAPGLSDRTAVTGDLTLGGTLNLIDNADANGEGSAGPGSYQIFTYTGSLSGSFAAITPVASLHHAVVDGGAGTGSGQGVFLDLYRLAAAGAHTPEPVVLGNFHVSATATHALSLTNTAANDGFSEKLDASFSGVTGAASASGSVSLLAPQATDTTSLVVGIDTSSTGHQSGTATLTLNSDGNGTSGYGTTLLETQTVNISGDVYRLAAAGAHTPEPVNLGIIHVGDSFAQQALSIQNTAADDGYSETLDAGFSGTTGDAQAGGSFSLLAPQATDAASLWVSLGGTGSAGPKSGTATIKLDSDGNGTSGLGITGLADQTVNVAGTVYRLAAATHSPEPVVVPNLHVGDTFAQTLTITNAAADDGYSEKLNASFGGTTGNVTTNGGSFTLLGPGSAESSSLVVGIDTSTVGPKSGTATLSLSSDGSGTSGLGTTALASQTVNFDFSGGGAVYRLAAASAHTPEPVDLGSVIAGGSFSQQKISLQNTAASDGYSEKLDAGFSGTAGAAQAGGSISLLAPQTTDSTSLWVSLDASGAAGTRSGSATIKLDSDGSGTSGLGVTGLAGQTVTLSGTVLDHAAPSFTGTANQVALTVDCGTLPVGGPVGSEMAFAIWNRVQTTGFTAKLNLVSITPLSGDTGKFWTDVAPFSNLAAGSSNAFQARLNDTSAPGAFSATYTLALADEDLSGATTHTLTLTLTGTAYSHAAAGAHSPEPVDLGPVIVGGSFTQQTLSIQNTATNDGLSEKLNASFSGTTGAAQAGGSISLLTPQATDSTSLWVNLDATGTAGARSGTATIQLESVGQGTTPLPSQTVNVTGALLDHADPSFADAADQASLTLDCGEITRGGPVGSTVAFAIWNRVQTAGFTAKLNLVSITPLSGDTGKFWTDVAPFSNLAAGSSNAFQARLNDSSALGAFTATYQLTLADEDLAGATSHTLTLTLTGTVVKHQGTIAVSTAFTGTVTVAAHWVNDHTGDSDDANCNDWVSRPVTYTAYLVLCYGDILCPVCPFDIVEAWLWLVDKKSRQVFVASLDDGGIVYAEGYCFGNGSVGVSMTTFLPYLNNGQQAGSAYITSTPVVLALAGSREKASTGKVPNILTLTGGATLFMVSSADKAQSLTELECDNGSELAYLTATFKKSNTKVKPDPYCPECSTACGALRDVQNAAVAKAAKNYFWWNILGEDVVEPAAK
ncbi:MAG: choice-of-anchor D domain-containing protein [Lentisphaeria bacterium]